MNATKVRHGRASTRPSTFLLKKDVDARYKAGHDDPLSYYAS
jgi:hypothetical protein